MVAIRRAGPGDVPRLAAVHSASLRAEGANEYSEAQLARLAPSGRLEAFESEVINRDDRVVMVAENGDRIVGWGGVRLDAASLLGVYVEPGATGRGIGRTILAAVEAVVVDNGLRSVTVFAALNAVGFYEACGYRRVGDRDARGVTGPFGSYGATTDEVPLPVVELRKEL